MFLEQSSINCCLALLMMAYREIGTGGSISWMYVGNAVRMVNAHFNTLCMGTH